MVLWDKPLEDNPKDDVVLINKSDTLFNLRKYNESIKVAEKALRINPKKGDAWYMKARHRINPRNKNKTRQEPDFGSIRQLERFKI